GPAQTTAAPGMSFQWPVLLLALLLVPLGILAVRAIEARRQRRVAGLGGLARAGASARAADRVQRIAATLVVGAFVLFAVALGRPQATISLPRIEGTLVL